MVVELTPEYSCHHRRGNKDSCWECGEREKEPSPKSSSRYPVTFIASHTYTPFPFLVFFVVHPILLLLPPFSLPSCLPSCLPPSHSCTSSIRVSGSEQAAVRNRREKRTTLKYTLELPLQDHIREEVACQIRKRVG